MKEMICIVCPKGCHLQVDGEGDSVTVTGHTCPRGEAYGKAELVNPTRVLTSTVRLEGGIHRRLPVRTDGPIPKRLMFDAMRVLDGITGKAPVESGQILVENLLDTGMNLIASRSMEAAE